MNVSGIQANNVAFKAPQMNTANVAKSQNSLVDKDKRNKAIAIASAVAAAIGVAGIAIHNIRKGKMLPKEFTLGADNIKRLVGLKRTAELQSQISEVASRISPEGAAAKAAELAAVFGAEVEHVAQRAFI